MINLGFYFNEFKGFQNKKNIKITIKNMAFGNIALGIIYIS